MLENILTVGNYVLILFILIGVGFVCNKTKILTSSSLKEMTNLVLYIVTPCVIINSYQREFDKNMLRGLLITLAAALLSFAINILLTHLLVKDKDKRREKTLRFGAVFSNCGYMSLPLQEAMLGEIGVFYGATYIAVFQIMLWTYGVILMSGSIKSISLKKIIINPGVLSTALGIVLYVFSISIPFTVLEPIKYLGSLNTPVPMVIVGYYLAQASLRLKGVSAYVSLVLRLIASPLIMIAILLCFGISGDIAIACTIAASAPVAAATTMFSEKFDGDTTLSATFVSITTILSIITMPLVVAVAAMI
ncbi:MAG: AEC family transporter [Clostridia bacterium]|nr:AEC family transporter [Clostridia bacterium]